MNKKKKMISLAVCAVIVIIAIIITVLLINNSQKYSLLKTNAAEQNNVIINVGEAVEFMIFLDENDINIDSNIYSNYKNVSEKIFDNIFEETLSSNSLGYLAVINKFFELNKDEYIQELFDKFYFEQYNTLRNKIGDDEEIPEFWEYMFTLIRLKKSDFDISEYGFDKKMADKFNSTIKKSGMNNSLLDIFWYFVYTDNLNMIEYQKARDYFLKDCEIDENQKKSIYFSNISVMNFYKNLFDNDNSLQNKTEETYISLNSDDDFGFYGNADDLLSISNTLQYSYIKEINKNKYLSDSADKWLDGIYSNVCRISRNWLGEE